MTHNPTLPAIADPCDTCPRERAADITHHQDHQTAGRVTHYENRLMAATTAVRTRNQNHMPEGVRNNEGHLETQTRVRAENPQVNDEPRGQIILNLWEE